MILDDRDPETGDDGPAPTAEEIMAGPPTPGQVKAFADHRLPPPRTYRDAGSIRIGDVEVRLDDEGELDEVCLYDADEKCLLHLERMSDQHIWMVVGGRVVVNVGVTGRSRAPVRMRWEDEGETNP